jgi:hypothetical protein
MSLASGVSVPPEYVGKALCRAGRPLGIDEAGHCDALNSCVGTGASISHERTLTSSMSPASNVT